MIKQPMLKEAGGEFARFFVVGVGFVVLGGLVLFGLGLVLLFWLGVFWGVGCGQKDLPCYRIASNMVFDVPVTFSETAKAIVVGSKLALATDALGVTDVTASGVCTVVDAKDANTNKESGDYVSVIVE